MIDPNLCQQSTNSTSTGDSSESKKSTAKSYRYPLKRIQSNSDYLEIKIVEYVPPGFTPGGKEALAQIGTATGAVTEALNNNKIKPSHYIYLPIPQNLSDQNSITWGEDSLNPLEAFGLSAGVAAITKPEEIAGQVSNFFTKAGEAAGPAIRDNQAVIAAAAGNRLLNIFGGNVPYQSVISRASGKVLQPNLELLFQGVNLRAFPFSFDFTPRDQREAREVKEIIRTFKESMAARTDAKGSLTQAVFINTPKVFLISYRSGNKKHPFLNSFKPCALTDISISYTGSNTYATYQDGTPVHIQMNLTFKELNPVYAEDYQSGDGKIGVGY